MAEPTPKAGIRTADPEQLPLSSFEGVLLVPLGLQTAVVHAGDAAVAVREPPVCGEWSFDQSDDADERGGATWVDTASSAVPVGPRRTSAAGGAGGAWQSPARSSASTAHSVNTAAARRSDASMSEQPAALPPRRQPAASTRPSAVPRSATPPTPLPALDELRSVHEAHPGDAATAISLATALDKRGNIEGALSVLERAIQSGADGVPLRCARATLLSGRLRYDDAEAELRRAAKLRADDPDVLLQQGILACRRAKWRDAVGG